MKRESTFKMLALTVLLVFSFSAVAEGLADRRSEMTHSYDSGMVIELIHAQHGPTAAGGNNVMKPMMDEKSDTNLHPKYRGHMRSHQQEGLTAHQYRQKIFGSNR